MATRAFGFRDADGHEDGAILCVAAAGNGDILGKGDAVVLVGSTTGSVKLGRGKQAPAIARAASGDNDPLFGYVAAIHQASATAPNFNQLHRPASTAMYISVIPFKPHHLYAIRSDGALTAEDVGENFNLIAIVDADTTYGLSKMELDASSVAISQTGYQMTLMGIQDDGQTAITDTNPVALVYINTIQQNLTAFGGI